MAIAKVLLNGTTVIDLTSINAQASSIESGKTFHQADGTIGVGSMALANEYENGIVSQEISGAYTNNRITEIHAYAFRNCTGLTSITAPNVTKTGGNAFDGCTSLSSVSLPSLTNLSSNCFSNASVTTVTLPSIVNFTSYVFQTCLAGDYVIDLGQGLQSLTAQAFYGTNNMTSCVLILRRTAGVVTAAGADSMPKPLWNASKVGTLYVPQSLLASYQTASNWSTAYGTENTTFLAIEGSYYETHYADGTPVT